MKKYLDEGLELDFSTAFRRQRGGYEYILEESAVIWPFWHGSERILSYPTRVQWNCHAVEIGHLAGYPATLTPINFPTP
jgi:hypothetical protein